MCVQKVTKQHLRYKSLKKRKFSQFYYLLLNSKGKIEKALHFYIDHFSSLRCRNSYFITDSIKQA